MCGVMVRSGRMGDSCQDGRAVQGAAFRSQSTSVGVGSNPTPDKCRRPFTSPTLIMTALGGAVLGVDVRSGVTSGWRSVLCDG